MRRLQQETEQRAELELRDAYDKLESMQQQFEEQVAKAQTDLVDLNEEIAHLR